MESAGIILYQIVVMFILIIFGYALYRLKIFTRKGCNQLSNFVLTAVCPAVIFDAFQKELRPELVRGLLSSFAMAAAAHVIFIILGMVFCGKRRGENSSVEKFAVTYSNCAFLGIPLISAVYGSDGIFFLTAYIAMFNLLSWTHGVMILTERVNFKAAVNALKAPAVIATAAGLACFFLKISLPDVIAQPVKYIASLNTPLAMLISGITIARSDLKAAFKKSGIYLTAALKLLVGPLLLALIISPFRADPVAANTILVSAACPTAASAIMFSARYGKNSVYASEIFAVSTILSAVTMPLVMLISGYFL